MHHPGIELGDFISGGPQSLLTDVEISLEFLRSLVFSPDADQLGLKGLAALVASSDLSRQLLNRGIQPGDFSFR